MKSTGSLVIPRKRALVMPDTSFSTRHAGAAYTYTSNCSLLHLFNHPNTEVVVLEDKDQPCAVSVTKYETNDFGYTADLTKVYVDWPTACEIAQVVSRRLEASYVESHPSALSVVRGDDK
jgi:hypothetical protein